MSGLGNQVTAVVAGRAVDAEAETDPGGQVAANGCDSRRETHIRRRAVSDTGLRRGKPQDFVVVDVDPMGIPNIITDPSEANLLFPAGTPNRSAAATLVNSRIAQPLSLHAEGIAS